MLPTHARRPHIFVDPESASPPKRSSFVGRPLVRWISWFFVFIVILWMFGPLIVNFASPPPLYDHGRPPHHAGEHRPPHPHLHSGWMPPPPLPHPQAHPTMWAGRAERVREAFVHAYAGYQKHALPYDELLPVSGEKVNK